MVDIQWLVGGEAGYGIITTGFMMSKIFARHGLSVFDYVEYPSLIRGGHNAYYVRASDEEVFSQKRPVDILVALNRETIDLHKHEVAPKGAIIYDNETIEVKPEDFTVPVELYGVPFLKLAKDQGADKLMINTVAVGASLGLFSDNFDILQQLLVATFTRKGEAIVTLNTNTAKAGYDFVKTHHAELFPIKINKTDKKQILVGGAEAVGMGAIRAGLKFAAIYPMTPINGILNYLAAKAHQYNLVIKEPEDEIAGINMAIGASFAGARSLAATSGGGFSLMVEGLGLAAQTETPLVIVEGMRPGPATGLPTWTDQGDVRFVLHAAQGDFPRVVLVPGDFVEAFDFAMQAFNIAEKYQLLVILLVDKYIMEGHGTVDVERFKVLSEKFKVERGKMLTDEEAAIQTDYKRYALVDDGVSPRTIPGQQGGIHLAGSDEHDERGLYNEEADMRVHMMDKRFKKLETAIADAVFPQPVLHGPVDAPLTIVSFGTTKFPILEAIKWLGKEGIAINYLQVTVLSPFPDQVVADTMKKAKKTLVVENNKTGQFEGLVREHTGLSFDHHLRKYDGRPFYPEEIVAMVKSIVSGGAASGARPAPTETLVATNYTVDQ